VITDGAARPVRARMPGDLVGDPDQRRERA
jgi:hypothetical protein